MPVGSRVSKAGRVAQAVVPLWLRGRLVVPDRDEARLLVDPWYHDFRRLGLRTPQREGIFGPNQRAKEPVLVPLVDDALRRASEAGGERRFLELFCADGYYGIYAATHGATSVVGVDQDAGEVAKANLVARLLGVDNARFDVGDVFDCRQATEVALCAGGLYHLSDPERLLRQLAEQVGVALVIQTVYHVAVDDPGYFEAPAPGWTWGCRFSLGYLQGMVERAGFDIASIETNELTGNNRIEDRGSAYLLCVPG